MNTARTRTKNQLCIFFFPWSVTTGIKVTRRIYVWNSGARKIHRSWGSAWAEAEQSRLPISKSWSICPQNLLQVTHSMQTNTLLKKVIISSCLSCHCMQHQLCDCTVHSCSEAHTLHGQVVLMKILQSGTSRQTCRARERSMRQLKWHSAQCS